MADLTDYYTVTLNTAAIQGLGMGPFSLVFQLVDGSGTGDANNNAFLSDFNFNGGSAVEPPTLFGGATGDLSSSVSITDSDPFFNAIFQGFNPGASLSFNLAITDNADVGSPTQDQFLMSILDPNGNGIPTLDTVNGSFLTLTLDGTLTPPVATFAADTSMTTYDLAAPTASLVMVTPEPGALILFGTVVAGLGLLRRRRLLRQ
jgi:hypothetical protein